MGFVALVFSNAQSAIHEIEAVIAILIGTVALAGAGIIGAIAANHTFRVAARESALRKAAATKRACEAAQAPKAA